jgi:hypothetical protein
MCTLVLLLRGSNEKVAIADSFEEEITLLVCGSNEMRNDYQWAIGLESTDDRRYLLNS